MPLPDFANEDEFRRLFIGPLLSKLGFIQVHHTHGPDEQGKDFLFADDDRFEYRRFYSVQAKNGSIGAGGVELDALLNQVRRCFTVRLRFHKAANEQRVSSVYIMASGSISTKAREYVSDWCQEEKCGRNVYCLDGDTLHRLDKYAYQRVDRTLRNLLVGVWRECEFNSLAISLMQEAQSKHKASVERARHLAIEQLLVSPPPGELVQFDVIQVAWVYMTHINRLSDRATNKRFSGEQWMEVFTELRKAWDANLQLRDAILRAIKELDARYSIAVEVIE